MTAASIEITHTAARIVVEGIEVYGPAKRRAAKQLGLTGGATCRTTTRWIGRVRIPAGVSGRTPGPPPNCAPCANWRRSGVERLAELPSPPHPVPSGAALRPPASTTSTCSSTATTAKSAEIMLLNQGVDYDVGSAPGPRGQPVDRLSLTVPCPALNEPIGLRLTILDADDLRGALKPDAQGRSDAATCPPYAGLLDIAS